MTKKQLFNLALVLILAGLVLTACGGSGSDGGYSTFKSVEMTRQGVTVTYYQSEAALAAQFKVAIPAPDKGSTAWILHNPTGCQTFRLNEQGFTLEENSLADGANLNQAVKLSVTCKSANSQFWLEASKNK